MCKCVRHGRRTEKDTETLFTKEYGSRASERKREKEKQERELCQGKLTCHRSIPLLACLFRLGRIPEKAQCEYSKSHDMSFYLSFIHFLPLQMIVKLTQSTQVS